MYVAKAKGRVASEMLFTQIDLVSFSPLCPWSSMERSHQNSAEARSVLGHGKFDRDPEPHMQWQTISLTWMLLSHSG